MPPVSALSLASSLLRREILELHAYHVPDSVGCIKLDAMENPYPVPQEFVGVKDRFGESGEPNELLEKFGLTKENIIKAVTEVLRMKGKAQLKV